MPHSYYMKNIPGPRQRQLGQDQNYYTLGRGLESMSRLRIKPEAAHAIAIAI
jgi:hypothetical protein